ncbi:putative toxin-antitoxin system toxin component, PIN family [Candidatus Gottesmanbacteria bacterium]|nr:putative toxin-antitoxin system toxin component, PIN family [Candidatus Gottesmanbacteria bacterium]
MLRVVLDTNVFISGIKSQNTPPGQILDAWRRQQFVLIASPQLIIELHEVLLRPGVLKLLRKTTFEVNEFIKTLNLKSFVTEGILEVSELKDDPDDNMILACAIEGLAKYIVTGNKKHFPFADYKGIKILSPREYLELLNK